MGMNVSQRWYVRLENDVEFQREMIEKPNSLLNVFLLRRNATESRF